MHFDTNAFLNTLLVGGFRLLKTVFLIVVPLMVILEVIQRKGLFDRLIGKLSLALRFLGFEREAIFSLLAGFSFGISYGAGVLLKETKEKRLNHVQAFLVMTFLGMCHAIFEDTALFVAVGANPVITVSCRFFAALLLTWLIGRYVFKIKKKKTAPDFTQ